MYVSVGEAGVWGGGGNTALACCLCIPASYVLQNLPGMSQCSLTSLTVLSTTFKKQILGSRLTGWLLWGLGKCIYTCKCLFSLGLCLGTLYLLILEKWRARNWVPCPLKLWGLPSSLNWKASLPALHTSPWWSFCSFSLFAIVVQAAEWVRRNFGSQQTRDWILDVSFFISFFLVTYLKSLSRFSPLKWYWLVDMLFLTGLQSGWSEILLIM